MHTIQSFDSFVEKEKHALEQEIAILKEEQLEATVFLQEAQKARLYEERKRDIAAKEYSSLSRRITEMKQDLERLKANAKTTSESSQKLSVNNDNNTTKTSVSSTDPNSNTTTPATDLTPLPTCPATETPNTNTNIETNKSEDKAPSNHNEQEFSKTESPQHSESYNRNKRDEDMIERGKDEPSRERRHHSSHRDEVFHPRRRSRPRSFNYYPSHRRPYF
jgi:hypothetical protein